MKLGFAGVLAVSAALVFGCSGKSGSGDDDADDGAGLTGGTSGVGGSATGGAAMGGTSGAGAGASSCPSLCERAQACPGAEPFDCEQACSDDAADAAASGCSTELRNFHACVATAGDLCTVDLRVACSTQVAALEMCFSGDPSGQCTEGGPPINATCTALCQRTVVCSGEAMDCAMECAAFDVQLAPTGCADEYQDYMGCASTCVNICGLSPSDCPTTYPAFADCLADFCATNPSTPPCGA